MLHSIKTTTLLITAAVILAACSKPYLVEEGDGSHTSPTSPDGSSQHPDTPSTPTQPELLIATNDTARFYLSGMEIADVSLSVYSVPSLLIPDSRYRIPTRLEVVTVFRDIALPYSYYHSSQRILCYDAPSDYGIKVNSIKFGTGYFYTYVPGSTVTRAGQKTKYCIIPIRTELRQSDGSKVDITVDDRWQ